MVNGGRSIALVAVVVAFGGLLSVGNAFAGRDKTPDTTITSAPTGTVASTTARVAFSSSDSHAQFSCKLDAAAWVRCTSPTTYSSLAQGTHTVSVRASNHSGYDLTPATATWTVDTVAPPVPSIVSGPGGSVQTSSATFSFTDSEPGVSFTCALDAQAATACTSPVTYAGLADGSHTFAVRALDAVRNASPSAAAAWTVDTVAPPAPTVTSAPPARTPDTSATLGFTDSDATVTFRCAVDGGAGTACASPVTYSGLALGSHSFSVMATDRAGNASPETTASWTVVEPTNYLKNPSFEGSLAWWSSWYANLTLVHDGVVGSDAAKVSLNGASTSYSVYPSSRPISPTTAGTPYTANGWVRSDTPGRSVCLRIREFDSAGSQIAEPASCVITTTTWQRFPSLNYTTSKSGGQLTAFVMGGGAQAGDSFEVDGMQLTDGPTAGWNSTDPIVLAAGDAACSPGDPDYNAGNGTGTRCMQKATAALIGSIPGVTALLPLGDNQYQCGALGDFQTAYGPTWGQFNAIARPIPGNHEYGDLAGPSCTPSDAAGYFQYFGARAGDPTRGYYSYDIGTWHLIALNSDCRAVGGCIKGSAEETWLQADLAAHKNACTLAYWHIPAFSNGRIADDPADYGAWWQDLYDAHAELVLSGHDHSYQRFQPLNASGTPDPKGPVELIVGTGGEELMTVPTPSSRLAVGDAKTFGVLKLQLHADGYDAKFMPIAGQTFADSFSGRCTP